MAAANPQAPEKLVVAITARALFDLEKGHVSWISPIAKALMRAHEGDVVRLRTPAGEEEIEIVKVLYI